MSTKACKNKIANLEEVLETVNIDLPKGDFIKSRYRVSVKEKWRTTKKLNFKNKILRKNLLEQTFNTLRKEVQNNNRQDKIQGRVSIWRGKKMV